MNELESSLKSMWLWPAKVLKMDTIRQRTQQLLDKLQNKYGMAPRSPRPPSACPEGQSVSSGSPLDWKDCEDAGGGGGGPADGKAPAVHAWYLVDPLNHKLRLPRTMLFLGRDECDIIIQSGTVDKRHAVITFDLYLSRFKVKDLSTTNGTYVNESRIPEQEYVTLNHMDSIRLGYDSKVYHMEQGELCGDSPPPPSPPLPKQTPPHQPSPHQGSGGDCSGKGWAEAPVWSCRPEEHRPMAECQGCIAEQRIEHTCTHANPSHPPHRHPIPHNHPHPHHDPHHPGRHPSPRFPGSPRNRSAGTDRNAPQREEGQEPGEHRDPQQDRVLEPEAAADPDSSPEHRIRQGRNTWPRKRVRQTARRTAAAELFGAGDLDDGDDYYDDGGGGDDVGPDDASSGSGELVVESGSNYMVSVDDSALCDGAGAGRGRVVVEYSLSRTGKVHRIPRNSKNVPLPPELETVKKGTPLYGQPSWWGEDTDTGDKQAMEPSQKPEARSPRPSSLVVHGQAEHSDAQPGPSPHPHHHHHHQHHKDSRPVYMEIPHTSTTPERDKPPSPPGPRLPRDKTTPARSSLTSSLSKDSLVLSPDSARGRSMEKEADPGKRAAPGAGSGSGSAEVPCSSNPALSFTVEFGDEKKKGKLKSGASLSQFVPPKLRSSLSSHGRPSEKTSASTSSLARMGRSDSDGSCKTSEERELSPIASGKQKRLEDSSVGGGSEAPTKGKSARRSSGQGTGIGSLRSSDFPASETGTAGSSAAKSRRDAEKRTRDTEKEAERKPPKPQDSRKSSSRPAATKGNKAKPQPSAAAIAASVQAAQYSDPTAYLIDRMFAGSTDSPRSQSSSEHDRSDSPTAPEHVMYKEARDYDRASQRGSATYRTSSSSSSSKPVQKQKSLSRSPASTNGKSPVGVANITAVTNSPKSPRSKTVTRSTKTPESKREKSADPDRSCVDDAAVHSAAATVSKPPALPEAPPPISEGGGADQEDKVSEAGTYTIEVEEDGEEEQMARQQIDEVFGVELNGCFPLERPIINSMGQLTMRKSSEEEEEGEEKTLHEDEEGVSVEPGCRTPCEEDVENVFDEGDQEEEEGEEGLMSRSMGEEEVPSWLNQLNSLTSSLRQSPASPKEVNRKDTMARGTEEASKKPPQGSSRKRPGTGRKLPSIPSANDQSPVSSEHSSLLHHNSPDSPANAHNGAGPARLENGHDRSTDDSPSRNVTFSPLVSSSSVLLGKSRLETSPCESEESGAYNINSGAQPKGSSVCSRGSIDTELLLRDTETVMAAMEARMGFRQEDGREEEGDSDSDLTSTVAMVNGDEDYVKPTKYHSPRDTMTGKVSKDKDNSNIQIASASTSRKGLTRSFSEQKPPVKGEKSPRSAAGVSVVSDVFSRSESLDQSFQSDASDAGSETTFSRSGSRGKGTITMTKPNRAFALRRARADGSEVTETARSRVSAASTAATASSRRSSSIHGTPRTTYSDRTGTEASLGAQIAKKARENTVPPRKREGSMPRQDGGTQRSSHRGTDRRSSASSSASSTISSSKKERDIRTLKSQLKSTPGNRDLAITGVGSSRSQSQPGSRSNSPKAAERMAWKRRKEYDPRKAVAEAKANKAKEPRPKPKVQSSSLYKQRMTRSASFTNSVELSGRIRHDTYNVADSTSSAEDLSSAATASDSLGETGFRRAFIPFHNPLRSDRLSHSADEDEAGTFPTSKSYDSLIVSSIYQLSLKLKTTMDKALMKLREQDRASITPSPIDDFLGHPSRNEIPAWKSANQELAGVLKNLRKMEHHLHLMERALFPDEDTDTDVSGMSSTEKHKYFQEIERIRSELAGFQPIDRPQPVDPGSPEMAELSKNAH